MSGVFRVAVNLKFLQYGNIHKFFVKRKSGELAHVSGNVHNPRTE